jgi:hypothetical protein
MQQQLMIARNDHQLWGEQTRREGARSSVRIIANLSRLFFVRARRKNCKVAEPEATANYESDRSSAADFSIHVAV